MTSPQGIQQRDPMPDPSFTPSLPLILARELASNLATPMFLLDTRGMLVFYNDAAELVIGKPFAEVGDDRCARVRVGPAPERARTVCRCGGETARPGSRSPSGGRRTSGCSSPATTAYGERWKRPRIRCSGAHDELHGVVVVFWEGAPPDGSG